MNKVAKKSVGRSKPAKKASLSSSAKPVKKRSAAVSAAKPAKKRLTARSALAKAVAVELTPEEIISLRGVPLAEVASLAAKAINMIAAKRSLSPAKKAVKLALVAEKLEHASKSGALSYSGAWSLANPFGIGMVVNDWKAVLR